jgi:hypothetical protein
MNNIIKYKICMNEIGIYGSYRNITYILPFNYKYKFNYKKIFLNKDPYLNIFMYDITDCVYNIVSYKRILVIITIDKIITLVSNQMNKYEYTKIFENDMCSILDHIDLLNNGLYGSIINILFTNIADNSKDPSKIQNMNIRKKYIQDFMDERQYIKELINTKKYDLIIFEELYTDVLYNNIDVDSVQDELVTPDYNIISDAAMRGEKKYYFDTFYKNYTVIYNKHSLKVDADYTYNVRMSRLINNREKEKHLSNLKNCDTKSLSDVTDDMIQHKTVEIKKISCNDIKKTNFFRLSYTTISKEDHNMQHNVFKYYPNDEDCVNILVCNIHMVNAYRHPGKDNWHKEATLLFENIELLCRNIDCVLICGDFNSCGNIQLFKFANKYKYHIVGSLDEKQSRSHMYCLFKNITETNYTMYLSNYNITYPVHNKPGNHPVTHCEFVFQRKNMININNIVFNIESICVRQHNK